MEELLERRKRSPIQKNKEGAILLTLQFTIQFSVFLHMILKTRRNSEKIREKKINVRIYYNWMLGIQAFSRPKKVKFGEIVLLSDKQFYKSDKFMKSSKLSSKISWSEAEIPT